MKKSKTKTKYPERGPGPAALYFASKAGGVERLPRSLISLWGLLGYEPERRVQRSGEQRRRWERVLRGNPYLRDWVASERGLRSPQTWPSVIGEVWADHDVFISPKAFSVGCFPGRQALDTRMSRWRGMPELCAVALGWDAAPEELDRARDAARALCDYVPFVVFACRPDFSTVALPTTDRSIMTRLIQRNKFLLDPLGRNGREVDDAVDTRLWSARMLRALPRLPWIPCTKRVPVERSLVESGVGGWTRLDS